MSVRPQPDNIPPKANLAIPFLERVLVGAPFPPIAIFLPRPFGLYDDNNLKLEVTAVTTTGDIRIIGREVERYRFGLSPYYKPHDRIYLCMDMYDFALPAAGTWRFQIKGYTLIERKKTEILSIIHDEVTEAVTAEN